MGKLTVVLQQVGLPAEEVGADSLEDASKKVTEWQDAKGLGASQLTSRHGIVRDDGRYTARIAYNGRVLGTPAAKEATIERLAAEVMSKAEKPKPIYVLMDAVAEAIREYDKSNDHLKHGPNSDCIRCRLEAVIHHTFAGHLVKPTGCG